MSKSVLIVDDEEATAWALAESLREEGFLARTAHSAAEAAAVLASEPVDLVITDVRLPDQTGFVLLTQLKATAARTPKAIVISAYGGPEIDEQVRQVGALAYVRKPFDVEKIKQLVAGAFGAAAR